MTSALAATSDDASTVTQCTPDAAGVSRPHQLQLYPWLPAGLLSLHLPQSTKFIASGVELTVKTNARAGNTPFLPPQIDVKDLRHALIIIGPREIPLCLFVEAHDFHRARNRLPETGVHVMHNKMSTRKPAVGVRGCKHGGLGVVDCKDFAGGVPSAYKN